MKTKKIECNLCGSTNYEIIYKKKKGEPGEKPEKLFKCNKCGLIFAEQNKNLKYYADIYSDTIDEEYLKEEPGRRRASVKILKRVEKYKKGGRLLDIGCTNGFLLDEARKRGWEVYGVEISKWAVDYARTKLNLNVKRESLKKARFPDHFFDAVLMLGVAEHLTDPKYTLLEARRILKRDGILYISTPNISSLTSRLFGARWWGIKRLHLFYFTKKTLEKMLDACGFKAKRYNPHVRVFSLNYWVRRLKEYNHAFYRFMDFVSRIDKFGNALLEVNLRDQIEILAVKARKLDYLVSSMMAKKVPPPKRMKVFVVLPAYNAEKTLKRTVEDIPKDVVDKIILVDDKSRDRTVGVAKSLGLEVYQHKKNMGYGANQKTCYEKALAGGADIVVMVHPDYQYAPAIIPKLIEPIQRGETDAVFGSRMMKGGALEGGMPLWKHNANILLTAFENVMLGTYLTEYHSGFRAYSADLLRTVNFRMNSDRFIFDTEIIVQSLIHHFKIEEVPIKTRYFDEASKIKFLPSVLYGLGIIRTMIKFVLHSKGIFKFKQFE